MGQNRDQKKHDSQRRDRILRFFLRPEIGQFCPHFGAISWLKLHRKPGQTWIKSTRENSKNPVDQIAPRYCRFLSLVVVERAVTKIHQKIQTSYFLSIFDVFAPYFEGCCVFPILSRGGGSLSQGRGCLTRATPSNAVGLSALLRVEDAFIGPTAVLHDDQRWW